MHAFLYTFGVPVSRLPVVHFYTKLGRVPLCMHVCTTLGSQCRGCPLCIFTPNWGGSPCACMFVHIWDPSVEAVGCACLHKIGEGPLCKHCCTTLGPQCRGCPLCIFTQNWGGPPCTCMFVQLCGPSVEAVRCAFGSDEAVRRGCPLSQRRGCPSVVARPWQAVTGQWQIVAGNGSSGRAVTVAGSCRTMAGSDR